MYALAEQAGIPVWCEDEAGPYQAIPQSGASWQPEGHPAGYPHEYIRGGTAKRLTLFHPATGQVRALPVEQSPHEVLHPWLKEELPQLLAQLPALEPQAETAWGRPFQDWRAPEEARTCQECPLVRLIEILLRWNCQCWTLGA